MSGRLSMGALAMCVTLTAGACSAAAGPATSGADTSADGTVTTTQPPIPTTTTRAPVTTSTTTRVIPTLPPGVENVVRVDFFDSYVFDVTGASFEDHEVSPRFTSHMQLHNLPDESGAPVYGLELEYVTAFEISGYDARSMTGLDPPTWAFGDPPEVATYDFSNEGSVDFGPGVVPTVAPGLDASLEPAAVTVSAPTVQTWTLTLVAHEPLANPDFVVHLDSNAVRGSTRFLDVAVTGFEPGEQVGPAGEQISVTPDRMNVAVAGLDLVVDEPYVFTMTVELTPLQTGFPYRPYVSIAWLPGGGDSGVETGTTLSLPDEPWGVWTWRSEGVCTWEWYGPGLQYQLNLNAGRR